MDQLTFERFIDHEGRLQLPDYLKDDYGRCVISLGFGVYLHLYRDEVWLEFHNALLPNNLLSEMEADRYVRFHDGKAHLIADQHGRIKLPLGLLAKAQISTNSWVVGIYIDGPAKYYRLYARELWQAKHGNLPVDAPE